MDGAVKQRHSADQEQEEFRQGQGNIEQVQDLRGVPQLRDKLAHCGAGHLGAEHMDRPAGEVRHHRDHQNQHAHAAHPVREAAPELHGMAHGFHVGQDGRAGGRKAGDRLKEGVDIAGDAAADHKGECADGGHSDPGQGRDQKALLRVDGLILGLETPAQEPADRQGQGDDDQKGEDALVPIDQRDQQGKNQQDRFQHQDAPQQVIYHFPIHSSAPVT